MIILTIRTDNPEAEVGVYRDDEKLTYVTWQAHRQLAETIHIKIREQLDSLKLELKDVRAIVCYEGPGSFTGLRIGLTAANALSYALKIPVVSETGDHWREKGVGRIQKGENETIAMPEYGADVHITYPKDFTPPKN